MKVVYTGQYTYPVGKRIFLAGPTPRDADTKSWRPEALQYLRERSFEGTVYIPEPIDGPTGVWPEYAEQCSWEHAMLDYSSCILFWVPRDMKSLPGMTTNIEFGMYSKSGKVVLGYPSDAEHVRYMNFCAKKFNIPTQSTLRDTVNLSIEFLRPQ